MEEQFGKRIWRLIMIFQFLNTIDELRMTIEARINFVMNELLPVRFAEAPGSGDR